ncbi:MAG: peptide deformylase [Candidatus Omnitrophica bacterium]|nr:peptide deformylase [Candidatus Omnitrophota bacterium]
MQLKIRLYGDPCLRAKSKPVKEVTSAERMLIASMFETMRAQKGVGLAAAQVGINEQIFVIDTGHDALAVVNPRILRRSGAQSGEEGCLSVPHLQVNVERAKDLEVEFLDEDNNPVRARISGLLAKIFQHENDHLQGKLIIDYLTAQERRQVLKDMKDGVYMGESNGHEDMRA